MPPVPPTPHPTHPWHLPQAMAGLDPKRADPHLVKACKAGLARCQLHCGDLRGGQALALQLGDVVLLKECAAILEGLKQLSEAAELYVAAGMHEKAASESWIERLPRYGCLSLQKNLV